VKFDSIPFDVKLKIIRNLLSGFYIFESGGLLEARLDYEYFSTYVGNCVYHEDLINEVFEHLYDDLNMWCVIDDKQRDH